MEKTKKFLYQLLKTKLIGEIESCQYVIADLANASALLNENMEKINWVGFYLMEGEQLILGPFQGKRACTKIQVGRGVCGTAAAHDKVIRVEDVHQFPGHIPCDSASQSEIVLPLHDQAGNVCAVLDIDSPVKSRFTQEDQEGLESLVPVLEQIFLKEKGRSF